MRRHSLKTPSSESREKGLKLHSGSPNLGSPLESRRAINLESNLLSPASILPPVYTWPSVNTRLFTTESYNRNIVRKKRKNLEFVEIDVGPKEIKAISVESTDYRVTRVNHRSREGQSKFGLSFESSCKVSRRRIKWIERNLSGREEILVE
jgi:hypothetical protein